ncbi:MULTISPECIES: Fic family protein [Burkholderiaceae]|uniref:Fic family protein n=1 Tax=Burkholderiaceae TaxID=119060 RepID=UPI00095ADA47|nr:MULTISPECIES: Fic family protein [Burkholderiaceae]SIT64895.1 Fic/DOC family protein [Burkholderia sp. b14]
MAHVRTDTLQITPEVLGLIARIDEFKGTWRPLGTLASDRSLFLRRVVTIESIGSSTRIEGSGLFDREDERHRGHYKTSSNSVAAFDENGRQLGVVFETATPFDTPRLMTELVSWVSDERDKARLHPLLIVAIFVVVFLKIHPFQDGNGRLSRVLTTLLLLQAGYAYVPYSSLESVIEANKESYYLALRQSQGTIRNDKPNWQPWLLFFLCSFAEQVRRLEKTVEREKIVLACLPALSLKLSSSPASTDESRWPRRSSSPVAAAIC